MLFVNSDQFAIRNHNFQVTYYHIADEKSIFEKMNEDIQLNQMFFCLSNILRLASLISSWSQVIS